MPFAKYSCPRLVLNAGPRHTLPGVALNALSILFVSLKSLAAAEPVSEHPVHQNPLLGVALILAGSFVRSLQYVFEEVVMTDDIGIPPLLLIGMEGFFGLLICSCILYPIASALPGNDHGSMENPWNKLAVWCLKYV